VHRLLQTDFANRTGQPTAAIRLSPTARNLGKKR